METNGNIGKIFYTNYSPRYKFKTRELWQFNAVRQFKRTVASVYPTQWQKYISVPNKFRVADMYKKDK